MLNPKVKLLTKYDIVKIWLVDGDQVRQLLDKNFAIGGHGYRLQYIPKDEVWIEIINNRKQELNRMLKEVIERDLMENGQIYLTANNMACKIMILIKTLKEIKWQVCLTQQIYDHI